MKETKQRRKKERTWAEAARLVLENYSDGPMTPKQILQIIESEGLKEMSGTSPLACLNAMLHSNSRGCDGLFYKLPGRISLFTLKKDAVQWSRNLTAPEGEELDDAADAESSGSNEASTVSGDNDVSLDETSSNASCSTEPQSKCVPAVRESHRAASQASKQKKRTGMMLPRVVLTPLKVNGAHMETSSGLTGRQAGGESSSSSSSSSAALGSAGVRSRMEIARDPPQLFRGFRKPASGQMKRNRGDDIDFETPGSILVNTNLRALINSRTFNLLPLHFQQQLLLLLPEVDRQAGTDGLTRLSGSALNNEFFAHAAQSWRERLADGEFTHEMQVRIRQEMEKEKKTEQWKERFFEDYYGQKLGLTREAPQQQNSVQEDAENRTAPSAQEEPTRPLRGPVTRQRDGHFKKRSLRCRAQRSLCKSREPEKAEAATEREQPVEPESPDCRETKPEVDLHEGSQASPEPEVLPEAPRLLSKVEDVMVAAAAAAGRIPCLPQESPDQESKEQKRKCFEQTASASFPEKKPRLEDRQSFRNTIESVHPEKPQPTKEEPKVPPIRIQLSRIKPPWVVKGQPAYQICPRIIPNPEPSSQDRNGAPATADFKACALQGRIQREAAASATAIGGGGGPGGGGRSTDEGGGGGGGGGGGSGSRNRGRQPSNRPKGWRSRRTRGKCVSNLQRAQLLPPSHLEGEAGFELAKANSPTCRKEASPPRAERDLAFVQAASITSPGAGSATRLAEASGSSHAECTSAELPLDGIATEALEGSSGPLASELGHEQSPGAVSQEDHDSKARTELPADSKQHCSWLADSPVNLLGGASRRQGPEGGDLLILNCSSAAKLTTCSASSDTTDLAAESKVEDGFDMPGLCAGEHLPSRGDSSVIGVEDWTPQFQMSPHQVATQRHERETQDGLHSRDEEAALMKPVPCSVGLDASQSCLPTWGTLVSAGAEAAGQQVETPQSTSSASDEETRSMLSETTETASDLEAELTDENAELNEDCREATEKRAALNRSCAEEHHKVKSEYSVRTDAPTHRIVLPLEAATPAICQSQSWSPQPSLPQKASDSSLHIDLGSQKRPVLGTPKPLSSIEASNPLVVQLLKGSLPLNTALQGAHSGTKLEAAASSLDKPSATCHPFSLGGKSNGCLAQKSPQEEGIGMSGTIRNGYCVPRPLKDLPERPDAFGPTPPPMPRERLGKEPESLEKTHPDCSPNSDSPGQVVIAVQKPEKWGLGKGALSSSSPSVPGIPEDSTSAESAPRGSPEGELKPPMAAPKLLSPGVTSSSPDQLSGDSAQKTHGAHGKKVFGSGFPCSAALRAQRPNLLEPFPILGMLTHSKPAPKSSASGDGGQAIKEDWPPKQQRAHRGGGVENKDACSGPVKRNVEKRKEVPPSPGELQSIPFVRDLPFFKLPREPGKGLTQPLEPSSIPSQLNIKQAFYGKLSKLQLNYASNTPVFSRSLAGSMMQLSHKANFAASHGMSLSAQMFADSSSMEEISLQCSCSLKAMIMCKGCGAFCHDDCIGPSKLCVLCLVVR
ncbi:polycomb group protein ASXL1 [Hemicordylus capensis]|uniref:polycomb group protein ASXL1 n=1 Tax=Hemicordylus capensis TaxID=884348 RepID=UPI0023030006|nr:polycomb group protein ASXL1 [Hemicordylus capensis]